MMQIMQRTTVTALNPRPRAKPAVRNAKGSTNTTLLVCKVKIKAIKQLG
jgi:hypothetical protein